MKFDNLNYPYNSKRNVVMAKNAMCASGNPQASAAGLEILKQGGNAVDAAIAMAATLAIVEPTANGIGGDNFAIIHMNKKIYGFNGSGPSPKSLSHNALTARGHKSIPIYGVEPITVPGAPAGWASIHEKFGKLSFSEVLQPAINYARDGYVVQPTVAKYWKVAFEKFLKFKDEPQYKPWFDLFTKNGQPYMAGEIFKSEDQAMTLEIIAKTKAQDFYSGSLADKIEKFIGKHDGFLKKSDLSTYKPEWVKPISINYRGYDIWEIPPNGHGITVLMALNILKGYKFSERDTVDTMHKQIEAMKLSFIDTQNYVADPKRMKVTVEQLLSEKYASDRRALISDTALTPEVGDPTYSSTVYFSTADKDGNMVSMIQSNYRGFGSGTVIPGTGIAMNDRAENFSFDKDHVNCVKGGVKPYHTIIPAFITKDNKPVSAFGIMGGFMQPQAHVQVVTNMIDFKLNPQAALDAPRWQWVGEKNIEVEQDTPNHIILQLIEKGHNIIVKADNGGMGRGQIIVLDKDNETLIGGTEKRTDGHISIW